jgi:RNA polymerase sporulation-specific sigma factor
MGSFPFKFPPQLTPEELDSFTSRPIDDADRQRMAEANIGLVLFVASRFPNIDPETAIEIGIEGLVKAARTFDPVKKVKIASYAAVCIKNQLLMFLRKEKSGRGTISMESYISTDKEGNELRLEDVVADKDPKAMVSGLTDSLMDLKRAFHKLSARDKKLITMFFYEELTQKEIGIRLGLSQSYVSRLLKRILFCLRSIMSQ